MACRRWKVLGLHARLLVTNTDMSEGLKGIAVKEVSECGNGKEYRI